MAEPAIDPENLLSAWRAQQGAAVEGRGEEVQLDDLHFSPLIFLFQLLTLQ